RLRPGHRGGVPRVNLWTPLRPRIPRQLPWAPRQVAARSPRRRGRRGAVRRRRPPPKPPRRPSPLRPPLLPRPPRSPTTWSTPSPRRWWRPACCSWHRRTQLRRPPVADGDRPKPPPNPMPWTALYLSLRRNYPSPPLWKRRRPFSKRRRPSSRSQKRFARSPLRRRLAPDVDGVEADGDVGVGTLTRSQTPLKHRMARRRARRRVETRARPTRTPSRRMLPKPERPRHRGAGGAGAAARPTMATRRQVDRRTIRPTPSSTCETAGRVKPRTTATGCEASGDRLAWRPSASVAGRG